MIVAQDRHGERWTGAGFCCLESKEAIELLLSSKEPIYNARDVGSIPGLGRSPGERKWQSTCLENPNPWVHKRIRQDWAAKQQQQTSVGQVGILPSPFFSPPGHIHLLTDSIHKEIFES